MKKFFLLPAFVMCACIGPAQAAEKNDAPVAGKVAEGPTIIAEPDVKDYQKKTDKIYDIIKGMSKDLGTNEQKHLYMVYSNYNLIGTVKMVHNDVGKAVDACSAANPKMEGDLRTRFQSWSGAVNGVLADSESHLDNMIAAQDYAPPKKFNDLFAAIDETRAFTNAQAQKTPVTSQEACDYLLDKMDDTQKNLTSMLRQTLMSVPPAPEPAEASPEEQTPPAKDE